LKNFSLRSGSLFQPTAIPTLTKNPLFNILRNVMISLKNSLFVVKN